LKTNKQTVYQSFDAADGLRLRGTAAGVAAALMVVADDVSLKFAVVVPAAVAAVLLVFAVVAVVEVALTAVMTVGSLVFASIAARAAAAPATMSALDSCGEKKKEFDEIN